MNAIERLRSDETLRREGVTLVVDAALARPLSEVVDLTGLSALAEAVLLRPIGERSTRRDQEPRSPSTLKLGGRSARLW